MKKIFLIRHAESEANAGGIFPHDNIIKITEKGKQQAKDLAEILDKPKRVIVSKLIRTQETAEPIIQKFPDSEVHLWFDVHEFEHIGKTALGSMTHLDEIKSAVEDYWLKADPDLKAEEDVESFAEFINRINQVFLKMKNVPDEINYVFTHGWFIKAFHLIGNEFSDFNKIKSDKDIYNKIMQRFCEFDKEWKTQNTGVYDVTELVEKYCK